MAPRPYWKGYLKLSLIPRGEIDKRVGRRAYEKEPPPRAKASRKSAGRR